MVVQRRDIWWAEPDEPRAAEPGFRRPALVVQAEAFNRSRIRTVLAVILTSNLRLLDAPGNVLLPAQASGLQRDSVVNDLQIETLDRSFFVERIGRVPSPVMARVDAGLRLVLEM